MSPHRTAVCVFFVKDAEPPDIYSLSLHDALPISLELATGIDLIVDDTPGAIILSGFDPYRREIAKLAIERDRKSTRLNSSHLGISYAVFCLKKKRRQRGPQDQPLLRRRGSAPRAH